MKIKIKLTDKTKEELKGIQGTQGDKGDKGDVGSKGLSGKDGIKGDEGEQGKDGKTGKQGFKGEKGLKGFKGDLGNDGEDGKDGTDGSPDTPIEIKVKLETLEGNKRLDASAIKGLTNLITGGEKKIFTSKDADKLYVPYTGATSDVNLGTKNLTVNQLNYTTLNPAISVETNIYYSFLY